MTAVRCEPIVLRVVVVCVASSGTGRETARRFAARDGHVL